MKCGPSGHRANNMLNEPLLDESRKKITQLAMISACVMGGKENIDDSPIHGKARN
ncbi:hypothetical protein AGMMS50256_13120 [Betaproteobacteria bacterium]|nr:hypothetical protein AGMMS50256_13120 [Betaproteobacteria bacterium]